MRFVITKDYDELSQVISSTMLKHMHTDRPRVNICVTTGTTPVQAYQILAPLVKDKPYFEHVHYYVVDEFWYAKEPGTQDMDIPVNKMSMDLKFFQAASIPEERIHTLRDETVDSFDAAIQQIGGILWESVRMVISAGTIRVPLQTGIRAATALTATVRRR